MFRQLVNAVSRQASAAKLPSAGLRLNASKSESKLKAVHSTLPHSKISKLVLYSQVQDSGVLTLCPSVAGVQCFPDPGKTTQTDPSIVRDESGLCATIH